MSSAERRAPLVVLGIDGGDPELIVRWAEQGHLPTLAGVMERGCWGRTAGPELISELGIWLSLFSGVSRIEHDYYDFRQLEPGTYDLRPFTARDARALPFWARFRGQGTRVAILDVPDGYPLPGLDGVQLANWATHYRFFETSAAPGGLLAEARRIFGPQIVVTERGGDDLAAFRRLLEKSERAGRLFRHLLACARFDLVVAVFAEAHTASHRFWRQHRAVEAGNESRAGRLGHAIRDAYRAIDHELGAILAGLPPEANVVLVTSAGMKDHHPTTDLVEAFCRALGYQVAPESGAPSRRPIDLVRRLVPERARIALSRHLPRETRERLLADQFRAGTDWSRTTAFAVPSFYTSYLRVNLAGREPSGTVAPGAPYRAVLDRLEADLRALIDADSGEPAVTRVTRTADVLGTTPHAHPDLFVEWRPTPLRRVVHPRAELGQDISPTSWDSGHSQYGFVAAMGPGIGGRGALGDVSPLDLAPTFLRLMGEALAEEMVGRPLERMLGPDGARA